MAGNSYRLDWGRPVPHAAPGERAYHATDGARHILVIVTDAQLDLAQKLARSMRRRNPDILLQDAIEEAIAAALHRRDDPGGELRLDDDDFA